MTDQPDVTISCWHLGKRTRVEIKQHGPLEFNEAADCILQASKTLLVKLSEMQKMSGETFRPFNLIRDWINSGMKAEVQSNDNRTD